MKKHYLDLKDKPFYEGLCKYMSSAPVLAMVMHTQTHTHMGTQPHCLGSCPQVWEGQNIVKLGRMMLGETNPAESRPGSIRGDLCIDIGR